jgi:hypothetical protein
MNSPQQRAVELTALLRSSADPLWSRLRSLLETKGLEPSSITVADLFRDDNSLEFGLIVTSEHKVLQFDFDYLHKTVATGIFSEWPDITATWRGSPYHREVSAALEVAG